jgi:hypothetical protein
MTAAPCAVCGHADARALTTTMLGTGEMAAVCGSHALMHERAPRRASSVKELIKMFGDRRDRKDRRDGTADELGARLIAAFSGDRRKTDERRA